MNDGVLLFSKLSELDGYDDDVRTIRTLVHLSCSKRSVRLSKAAKRKTYCPSIKDCQNSFVIFAAVSGHSVLPCVHSCLLLLSNCTLK